MVNDQVMEDLINQLRRNNGLQQQLIDSLRRDARGNRGGGRPPRGGGNGGSGGSSGNPLPKSLSTLGQAASQLAGGFNQANNASDAMGAMFKGVGTASKVLPVFGGALGLAAQAAQQFYEFLNGNLQSFNQLNEAGLSASGGMFGLQKALATGRLSMDEFMSATANYKDVIGSMGTEGVQVFGNLMNSVINTQDSMGTLNMSNRTLASTMAGYLKQQKAYSSFEKMDKQIQSKAARDYADQIQRYSKGLGMTIDELSNKMAKSSENVTGLGTQIKLMEEGMSEADATKSTENLNMVMNSFGEFGSQLNQQISRFIATGGDLDMDSTIGQLYQVNDQFRDMFGRIVEMTKSGQMSTDEGREMVKNMMASKDTADGIVKSFTQARYSFDDAAANQIAAFYQQVKNYNTSGEKAVSEWDTMMTNFNKRMEDLLQSFKISTAELFMDPRGFLMNMFGEKWGSWILDGVFKWEKGQPFELPDFHKFMQTYFKPAVWFYDIMMGYGSEAMDRVQAIEKPSWENILRALVPNWLADIIFEGGNRNADIAGASEMGDRITTAFEEKFLPELEDGFTIAGKEIQKNFGQMKSAGGWIADAVASWWNKAPSQTTVTNSTINNQNSVVNKPTTVNEAPPAGDKASEIAKRQEAKEYQETLLDKVERLIRAVVESNDTNRENLRVAKETAQNTANTSVN